MTVTPSVFDFKPVVRYAPVAEACGLCERAVEFYEKRGMLLEVIESYPHMREYRGEYEAWVRVGRWLKTGRAD